MGATEEELELIQRCIAGERDGWQEMMRRYSALVAHAVRTTFLRVLKRADPNQVDDVIQAVWLSLCDDRCRRLKSFQSKSALSTWLTVISSRKALDALRTERRKGSLRNVHLDDEERDLVKELQAPEAEERFSLDEIFILYEAMERLPTEDRLILKMYYLDGLSYRSIAEALRVAPNTVSSYILRAREKLKKCMNERAGGV